MTAGRRWRTRCTSTQWRTATGCSSRGWSPGRPRAWSGSPSFWRRWHERRQHRGRAGMRKLFWSMMVSLDVFMEGPNRELDWHVTDDEFAQYIADMGRSIDTILFGRLTYQMMAEYWPTSEEAEAPMMNDLPKVVVSRTLDRVEWKNSRLLKGNIRDEI